MFTQLTCIFVELPNSSKWAFAALRSTIATRHYEQLAQKYGLLSTGGPDSHGSEISVGSVRIPYSIVGKLRGYSKSSE